MNERKLLYGTVAILAVVLAWDFLTRVRVGRDASARKFDTPGVVVLPPVRSVEEVRRDLGAWLPGVEPLATDGMSDEMRVASSLRLVGTFQDGTHRFALLSTEPKGAGAHAAKLRKVSQGDEIAGLKVVAIGAQSIRLQNSSRTMELRLFKNAWPKDSSSVPGSASTKVGSASAGASSKQNSSAMQPHASGGEPDAQVQTPKQLAPGEEVKLPWNLPIVEDDSNKSPKAVDGFNRPADQSAGSSRH